MATPIQINLAELDDQTAAQVPMSPIAADATHLPIPGPSTQDGLAQLSEAVKTAQNANVGMATIGRPWAKEGDAQATNGEAVLVSDNVFHIGKVNEGADFTALPADPNYLKQTQGNTLTTGVIRTKKGFITDMDQVNVVIDPVNGNDNLDPILYFSGGQFKTGDAAFKWANKVQAAWVVFSTANSLATNRIQFSAGFYRITGRNIRLLGGFWEMSTMPRLQNCFLDIVNINIKTSGYGGFDSSESKFSFQIGAIEHGGTNGFIVGNSTMVNILSTPVSFLANNLHLFGVNVSNIWQVSMAGCTLNAGAFTGCSLLRPADVGDTAHLYLQNGQSIPSNISVLGMSIHVGRTIVLGQTTYDPTNTQYSAVFHKATPIRLPDLQSAPEMVGAVGFYQKIEGEAAGNTPLNVNAVPFTGASNGTVMSFIGSTDKAVTFPVTVPNAGNYVVKLHYSYYGDPNSGMPPQSAATLSVDGGAALSVTLASAQNTIQNVPFAAVALTAGAHSLKLSHSGTPGNAFYLLDFIEIIEVVAASGIRALVIDNNGVVGWKSI